MIQINNQWILLTTICHQIITLQLLRVVLRDLALNVCTFQTRIDRQQLILTIDITQIIPDITGHRKLVVDLHDLCLRLRTLRHIQVRSSLHIWQQMLTLIA